ncbi:hypothetical protein LJC74_07990 [Eubacteriales bacterium OttesenSCG-928-A19]|nr:hypothetical protein [Eubacteriales bacterium OttesenSCG-928-A19]
MDMKSWASDLAKAVPPRHSVRAFLSDPLPDGITRQITAFADGLMLPFEHNVKVKLFTAEPGKKLYNNGINPVNNLALMAQTDLVSISKAGFVGELVMLYAVKQGLSTCWFGHYKLSEVGRYIEGITGDDRIKESTLGYGYGKHVDVGERVICCMPFGHKNEATKRLVDVVAGKRGANRKPLESLMEQPAMADSLPPDIKEILELAKLAPSAANSQMWRFGVREDYRIITIAKPVGYKHFKWEHPDVDVGMCAAHAWLGLLEKGYAPSVEVRQDADRAVWTFRL